MLSYYSMPVSSVFIPEGLIALFTSKHGVGVPADLEDLNAMMMTFSDLLKNEHMFDHVVS